MKRRTISELIVEAERHLTQIKRVITQQRTIVERLKQVRANDTDATEFLWNLQERQAEP